MRKTFMLLVLLILALTLVSLAFGGCDKSTPHETHEPSTPPTETAC